MSFYCAIETRDKLPTPEDLRLKITEEWGSRKHEVRATESNVMFAKRRGNNKGGKNGSKDGSKDVSKDKSKFKFKCHRCRKAGHKAAECPESKKEGDNANHASGVTLYACADSPIEQAAFGAKETAYSENWCLDSGCTTHLCRNSENFVKYAESDVKRLNLANSASTEVKAKRTVSINAEVNGQSKTVMISDSLHVPDLRTNLLSVGKITDKGFKVIFDKESATIVDKSEELHTKCHSNKWIILSM